MKETREMLSLWKHSVQWEKMTRRQKALSIWFSLSFVMVGACGGDMLPLALALVNFGAATYFCVKNVPMEEE